jgi:hypothetical protein
MDHSHPLADPIQDCAELKLQEFVSAAGTPEIRAELDRYDIAVVLKSIYEWRGYRYTNASDAIAAAKRGAL